MRNTRLTVYRSTYPAGELVPYQDRERWLIRTGQRSMPQSLTRGSSRTSSGKPTVTMLLYRLRKSKNRGHVLEIHIAMTDGHQGLEAQTMD